MKRIEIYVRRIVADDTRPPVSSIVVDLPDEFSQMVRSMPDCGKLARMFGPIVRQVTGQCYRVDLVREVDVPE